VALSPQGTVAEQGTFEQLRAGDGYVAGLAARHMEKRDATETKSGAVKPAGNDVVREIAPSELDRPVRDWAVYNYYFTSLGGRRMAVWAVAMVLYSMLLRFPGKMSVTPTKGQADVKRSLDQILDERYCCPWQLC
jgi:ATP-binding cassette subfamily C (CFTR/MRP) protein 1